MKIDRLIGILSVLLQKEKVTAPMLAAKFEVSRKTLIEMLKIFARPGSLLLHHRVRVEESVSWTDTGWTELSCLPKICR